MAENNSVRTLVICPKSLKENWQREIDLWSDFKKEYLIYTKEEFRKESQDVLSVDCIIVDEAHYFGNMKSQMTKSLLRYIKKHSPDSIYLLTATPYMSTPWNIYSLATILGKTWSYGQFKYKFFYDVNMGGRRVPVIKKGIAKDIAKLVKNLGNTVALKDCLDVPDSIFMTEYFELTPVQKKAIKEIDDINHIVRWTKTHQICGGTLKGNEYQKSVYFKAEKEKRLLDLVAQNAKIAVICRYNNEIDSLAIKIQKIAPVVKITGQVKDKDEAVKVVNRLEKVCVLINAMACEGYGLPTVPVMVFYSYDFSLKNYIQMIGRIQRINAIQKCVYKSLVVKGTIDEDIYKMVAIKKKDFQLALYKNNDN